MIATVAVFLSSLLAAPQNPSLRLPASQKPQPNTPATVQRPVSEIDRFVRHVARLRTAPVEVERALQTIAQEFPDVEALILQRLPAALANELQDLMVAARRFATPRIADEIQFQLLARPVGEATRDLVETMATLKGERRNEALRTCIRGRIAGVRRAATESLARTATAEDLDFALELVDEQQLDFRLSGIDLLAAVPTPRARERLIQLLAKDPTVAGAACMALQRRFADARADLMALLTQPAIDRSFHYAAFLVCSEDKDGTQLPPVEAVPALEAALKGVDPIAKSLAGIALGRMCYYGKADTADDAAVVAALLDVVVGASFVPNYQLLRGPAENALQRLTGRTGTETVAWRDWWKESQKGFAGLRSRIDLNAEQASFAVIVLRDDRRVVRLLGEQLADLPTIAGALEYVVDAQQMGQLVASLQQSGFMQPGAIVPPAGAPIARTLELSVGDARTQVGAPIQAMPAFDALAALVDRAAEKEFWQLLRHPADEPERGAFWRAERRARLAQTDPMESARRSLRRAVRVWPLCSPVQRKLVLAWMLAFDKRGEVASEEDGRGLLQLAESAPQFGEEEMVLCELAASSPGDAVWRECVDVVARRTARSRASIDRVFAVLGADRVLQALADERVEVRRAAIDQAVAGRDLRAQEPLIQRFDDEDPTVRRAAVFAVGQLRLSAAREPLVKRILDEQTDPFLRRDALLAIGKIGGDGAFSLLQRALASPVQADRDAALRGLGELKDPRAADQLAEIFAASVGQPNAELARAYLTRMGQAFAVPALRKQLDTKNPDVRQEIVLTLATWQDPQSVPDLIELLQRRHEPILVAGMLSGTTGLDLDSVGDPVYALDAWYRDHRQEPQWRWLLQALERDKITHSLAEDQLSAQQSLAALPELARLMCDAEQGRIRVLASAVLRQQSGEDYGTLTTTTPTDVRQSIAARYRELYEGARAAQGR